MADALNIQPQVTAKKDNTARNTSIATGVGAVGGGTAGYLTKKILKDGEFTDEFVKNFSNKFPASKVEQSNYVEGLNKLHQLGDNVSIDDAKSWLEKYGKEYESFEGEIDDLLKKTDKEILDEIKPLRETLIKESTKIGRKIKGKAGLIWGGASALILGFGTWVVSKVVGNKKV